ncbi:long-chain fatty acid--CoA ligase [Burkholderia sp. SCN-KJ]|uniref:long-chain fatty acid--CoA ligase n=1 Tax=Burkholderia sp. SCN-KJ TaxID=2969248 RepID=UPI00214F7228|nr:long-chain fatty acid--CoA ligase [Burkholderia sp. SCN-KJ]MCR4471364.1 long-chain fatty acid--CoA ligase [Burkholderia sp. SCN-KJ]
MMLHTMMNVPLTIGGILEHAARVHANVEIVSRMPDRGWHRYTVGEFAGRVARLASMLCDCGLRVGDRVATLMWNHYAHLESYFAIPAAGGVTHTLNPRMPADNLVFVANHGGARLLIVDEILLPVYESIRERTHFEQVIIVPFGTRVSTAERPHAWLDYEALIEAGRTGFRGVTADENRPVSICYTSGTSGQPKGVVYSHRALVLHAFCIALPDVFNLSMRQTLAPVVPMFHVNGWCLPFAALLTGTRLVLPGPRLDADSLFELLAAEQVTLSAGVPSLWHGLIERLQGDDCARARLAPDLHLVVAGAACPAAMLAALDRLNISATHAWGMTEISPVGAFGTLKPRLSEGASEQVFSRRLKQGMPLPFVDVRIMTTDGEAAWDGSTVGELQVRGPWVAARYHDLPASESWTEDGWLCTGDAAHIDDEGYVQIVDRMKDLIKSGGEWISSIELENALMGHPAVKEAAVVARVHPKWQERPVAYVTLRDGASASAQALFDYLAVRFTRWWLPDAIEFIDEIPKTSTGKFQKMTLREHDAIRRAAVLSGSSMATRNDGNGSF